MAGRPKGSRNKPVKKEDTIHSHNVTTQTELALLETICLSFEKLGEEQRGRAMDFFIDRYKEYLPIAKQ